MGELNPLEPESSPNREYIWKSLLSIGSEVNVSAGDRREDILRMMEDISANDMVVVMGGYCFDLKREYSIQEIWDKADRLCRNNPRYKGCPIETLPIPRKCYSYAKCDEMVKDVKKAKPGAFIFALSSVRGTGALS